MPIGIRCDSAAGRRFSAMLRRDAVAIMRATGLDECELSIALVSDAQIRELNRDWRGKDQPTDVLSFSQVEQKGSARPPMVDNVRGLPLGDVVISVDTAIAQARKYGVTPTERIRTLLIHGFLHLLGFDHERSPADARKMFAREREIATAISPKSRTLASGLRSGAAR